MKNLKFYLTILLVIAIIILLPFFVVPEGAEFGGADGEGGDEIANIDPSYEPWAESPIELPSGEIESMLFSLQAALGAGVIFYSVGYLKGRKTGREQGASGKTA